MLNSDIIHYYKIRAPEYENIYYNKPERQQDRDEAAKIIQDVFFGKQVLEIACGTGYWTERIAQTAGSILATDINQTMLEMARRKNYPRANVRFKIEDIFNFSSDRKHESLFGGFIWSHIYLQELEKFIDAINALVKPGATIALMDNNYVDGSSIPISNTDERGNTFQTRVEQGSTFHVLKNFPSGNFLERLTGRISDDIKIIQLQYFWIVVCKTRC